MIIGIVASEEKADAAVGADDYRADFIAGAYSALGVAVTAADVVANPEFINANGLDIGDNSGFASVALVGEFLAVLLTAQWTVVIECEVMVTTSSAPLTLIDDAGGAEFILVISFNDDFGSETYVWDAVANGSRREAIDDGLAIGLGVHRIAVSRSDTRLAISVDGRAVQASEDDRLTGSDQQPVHAQFGGYDTGAWDNIRIRSIRVEPTPVDDSLLPALSA